MVSKNLYCYSRKKLPNKQEVMENINTKNLNRLVFSNESHTDFAKGISEELIPENSKNIRINNAIPSWNAP